MKKTIAEKIIECANELKYIKENYIGKEFQKSVCVSYNCIPAGEDGGDNDLEFCSLSCGFKDVEICRYNVETDYMNDTILSVNLESVDFNINGVLFDCIDLTDKKAFANFVNKFKTDEDITYEVCPHCEKEVKLDDELKVQICPNCGKHIVTCSMCLNGDCSNCCLCNLADEMNRKETDIMDTTNAHNPLLVELLNTSWKSLCHDIFKPIFKALYYRDYTECVEKSVFKEGAEMWLEDFDWEGCAYEYLMEVADDTDLVTILNFVRERRMNYLIEKK